MRSLVEGLPFSSVFVQCPEEWSMTSAPKQLRNYLGGKILFFSGRVYSDTAPSLPLRELCPIEMVTFSPV